MLFIHNLAASESPEFQEKRAEAVRVDTPPVIDGVLDDNVWKQARVIEDLHQVYPDEYAPPTQHTKFLVIFDKNALYIGAHCYDDEPDKIIARVLKQGGMMFSDDHISIVLDPFNNKRSGYLFLLSVNSVRWDEIYTSPREMNWSWDGIWHGKAARTSDGWTAEVGIPFKSLSFPPDKDTWGFTVGRDLTRIREQMSWTSRNRLLGVDSAGELNGLTDLDLGMGLEIIPSLSLRRTQDYSASETDYFGNPSLNVFYQITTSLNASLTINTDFSATEVDARQINLTRFALFFPEKRIFFLKDSDIFEFGGISGESGGPITLSNISPVELESGRPYFSRTIGLSPDGEPVDIDYGGKLSGRIGEWDFAAQYTKQASYQFLPPSMDGEKAEPLHVDTTDIFVGRVVRNILEESTIGAMVTYGDPNSDLDNTLFGVDFRYNNRRIPGQNIEVDAWFQKTNTEGLANDNEAWGISARLVNNTKLRGRLAAKEIQENFNPALGFVNRQGVRYYIGEIGYAFMPKHDFFREFYSGVEYLRVQRLTGGIQTSELRFRVLEIDNHQGDRIETRYHRFKEDLTEDFSIFNGVNIPPGFYRYDAFAVTVRTADQRKLAGDITVYKGNEFNGDRWMVEGGLLWRPSKHFGADARYTYNDFKLPYGDFVTRLISFQTDIVFSHTLSWTTLVQYDNQSNDLGIHSRLHFIPQAGREFFFVINHNFIDKQNGFSSKESEIVLKVNYTFRF